MKPNKEKLNLRNKITKEKKLKNKTCDISKQKFLDMMAKDLHDSFIYNSF